MFDIMALAIFAALIFVGGYIFGAERGRSAETRRWLDTFTVDETDEAGA